MQVPVKALRAFHVVNHGNEGPRDRQQFPDGFVPLAIFLKLAHKSEHAGFFSGLGNTGVK